MAEEDNKNIFDFDALTRPFHGGRGQPATKIVTTPRKESVVINAGPQMTAVIPAKSTARNWIAIRIEDQRFCVEIQGSWSYIVTIKDKLKIRGGYQWDGNSKVWWRPIPGKDTIEKRVAVLVSEKQYFLQTFGSMFDVHVFDAQVVEREMKVEVLPVEEIRAAVTTDGMSERMSAALLPHQWEGVQRFRSQHGNLLLAWSMGVGKTLGSAAIVAAEKKSGIIVCPVSLIRQWKEELLKWDVAAERDIFIFTGDKRQNVEGIYSGRYKFFILNYEKLSFFYKLFKLKDVVKLLGSNYKDDEIMMILNSYSNYQKICADIELKLAKLDPPSDLHKIWDGLTEEEDQMFKWLVSVNHQQFVLIYDEMSKIKNYKSQLARAHGFFRHYNWAGVIGLTGTPLENHLGEFYQILNFVQPGWMTLWAFHSKYAYKKKFGGFVYHSLREFNQQASSVMYRLSKEDVRKDMPPMTQEWRFCSTPKVNHRIADEIIAHALEKVESGESKGNGIFEVYSLLRTLDSYFGADDEVRERHGITTKGDLPNDAKYTELLAVLEEVGDEQILIFTAFEKTAKWLAARLKEEKYNVQWVSAAVKNKDDIRDAFNRGDIQIVVCTDVWARGVDFPQIPYLAQWDIPFNPAIYMQRRDRIYRINSRDAKTVINFVGSIVEESVYDILKSKTKNFEVGVEGVSESDITAAMKKKWGFKDKENPVAETRPADPE